jgi:hypothetical protein
MEISCIPNFLIHLLFQLGDPLFYLCSCVRPLYEFQAFPVPLDCRSFIAGSFSDIGSHQDGFQIAGL